MSLKNLKSRNTFFILLFFPLTAFLLSKNKIDQNALFQYGTFKTSNTQNKAYYRNLFKNNTFGFGYLKDDKPFILLDKKKYSPKKKLKKHHIKNALLTHFKPSIILKIKTPTTLKDIQKTIQTQMDSASIFVIKLTGEFQTPEKNTQTGTLLGYWIPPIFNQTTPTGFHYFLLNTPSHTIQKITTLNIINGTLELDNKSKLTFNLL